MNNNQTMNNNQNNWTTDKPTQIGWYWCLLKGHERAGIYFFDGITMVSGRSVFALDNFIKFGIEPITIPSHFEE